jgi:hypothetical protein
VNNTEESIQQCFSLFKFVEMVEAVKSVVATYQQRLMGIPFAPKTSFGRAALGVDGAANQLFLTYLFIDMGIAINFLKDSGLIRRQMTCNTCGRGMTWCVRPQSNDVFFVEVS